MKLLRLSQESVQKSFRNPIEILGDPGTSQSLGPRGVSRELPAPARDTGPMHRRPCPSPCGPKEGPWRGSQLGSPRIPRGFKDFSRISVGFPYSIRISTSHQDFQDFLGVGFDLELQVRFVGAPSEIRRRSWEVLGGQMRASRRSYQAESSPNRAKSNRNQAKSSQIESTSSQIESKSNQNQIKS